MAGNDPTQQEILKTLKHIRSNTSVIGVCILILLIVFIVQSCAIGHLVRVHDTVITPLK